MALPSVPRLINLPFFYIKNVFVEVFLFVQNLCRRQWTYQAQMLHEALQDHEDVTPMKVGFRLNTHTHSCTYTHYQLWIPRGLKWATLAEAALPQQPVESLQLHEIVYNAVLISIQTLNLLQGYQCFLQRTFDRYQMCVWGLSWQIWTMLIFIILNSMVSGGRAGEGRGELNDVALGSTLRSLLAFFKPPFSLLLQRFRDTQIQLETHFWSRSYKTTTALF